MIAAIPAGLAAGWVSDRLFGEPPAAVHPVAHFGSMMTRIEARTYSDATNRGVLYGAFGVGLGAGFGFIAGRLAGKLVGTALVSSLAMAGAMLEAEGLSVASALESSDIVEARRRLSRLVGRSTDDLSETEISRAVVETIAENTVDAVTSTLFWACAGGPTAAAAHRAINTMDAMVGHHNRRFERFGWASARLDDAANWIPARLTALAVIASAPNRATQIVRAVRNDAPQHPSPNGGVIEAAFAAALDVRLGGSNTYGDRIEHRGVLGDGRLPTAADIERAASLARRVALLFLAGSTLGHVGCSRLPRRMLLRPLATSP